MRMQYVNCHGSVVLLAIFISLILIEVTAGSWNFDQNRLQIESSGNNKYWSRDFVNGKKYYPNQFSTKSQYQENYNKQPTRYRNEYNRGSDIEYSHYSPTIITAPRKRNNGKILEGPSPTLQTRNIYKSSQDPAAFYKNSVFINVTDNEKKQMKNAPRVPLSTRGTRYNEIDGNDFSRKPDGVAIHLNGATIRVRSDPKSQKSQAMVDKELKDSDNSISDVASKSLIDSGCVRCPSERTVIAGRGKDKTALLAPQLQGCRGAIPPATASFRVLYGPHIGDLLPEGSHVAVGEILINNQTQQLCQYRYNVVVPRCPSIPNTPEVQVSCPRGFTLGAVCRFSCVHKHRRLKGRKMTFCKDDMKWSANPPKCEEPKGDWCNMRPVTRHGKMTCDTPIHENIPSTAVPNGSVCSVSCHGEHEKSAPKIITCNAGTWHGGPPCKKSRRRRHRKLRMSTQG